MAYKRNSPISVVEGGTGDASLTAYSVICGGTAATNPVQSVASLGNAGEVLTSNGAAALPTWQAAAAGGITTINGDSGSVTGATITLSGGGYNVAGKTVTFSGSVATMNLNTTDAAHNTMIGKNTGGAITTANYNVALGEVALSNVIDSVGCTAIGYGALQLNTTNNSNVAIGRLALGSTTSGSVNIGIGTNAGNNYTSNEDYNICLGSNGILGDSHVMRLGYDSGNTTSCYISGIDGVNVGSVAKVLTMASNKLGTATITAGTGISVTPGANTITITNTGVPSVAWSVVTVDAGLTVNTGTFANKAGLLTMTLPATGAIGDIIEISNMNTAVGWRIAQNANQYIRLGSSLTTTGVGGYLEATQLGDSIKLVCNVAGASTGWMAVSVIGNITVA